MAQRPPRDPERLSATQLAELAVCEARKVREWKQGGPPPIPVAQAAAREAARQNGVRVHATFHRQATAHHNQAAAFRKDLDGQGTVPHGHAAGSKYCFIATQVFGPDHPRTWHLRRFREHCLRPHAPGRWLVRHYYRTAPAIARWLDGHRRTQAAVRTVLEGLCALLPSWKE